MDENSICNRNKLVWDLITPSKIKEELYNEKQHEKVCRRSSICTELPLRTIYAQSPLANYFIREHFFQNPLEKYYKSFNLTTINDSISEKQESLFNLVNLEMEQLNLKNCKSKVVSNKSQSNLSLILSDDSLEEEIVNKGFYEYNKDHNICCEKDGKVVRRLTEFDKREFNDTLDEMDILLGNNTKSFSSTQDSGLIKCSSLNLSGVSPAKTKNWIHSEPVSTVKTIFSHKSNECTKEIEKHKNKNVKSSNLKKIRSPVGVYIKNPSTLPLVQHISVNPLIKKKLFEKSVIKVQRNKENLDFNLPLHVYKPAKHEIVSKKSTVKLPSNIQKRIPTTPKVIKHSRRITKRKICGASLEIELLKENLTNICDASALNSTSSSVQEISVLSTKEEYIK